MKKVFFMDRTPLKTQPNHYYTIFTTTIAFFHQTLVACNFPTDYYDDYRGGSEESLSDGRRKQSPGQGGDRHPTTPSRPAFPNTFTFYNDDLSSYSVYDSPLDGKTTSKKTSMCQMAVAIKWHVKFNANVGH